MATGHRSPAMSHSCACRRWWWWWLSLLHDPLEKPPGEVKQSGFFLDYIPYLGHCWLCWRLFVDFVLHRIGRHLCRCAPPGHRHSRWQADSQAGGAAAVSGGCVDTRLTAPARACLCIHANVWNHEPLLLLCVGLPYVRGARAWKVACISMWTATHCVS